MDLYVVNASYQPVATVSKLACSVPSNLVHAVARNQSTAEGCTEHGNCDAPADLGACLIMAVARIAAVVAIL